MEPVIRYCTSADGTRIGYVLWEGGSRPCISVPGWGTSGEHAARRDDTRSVNEFYAEGRALVEFDRRGVGLSEREPGELSLDAEVADVTAVADHLCFERFDLAGFHDGAFVAAAYAAAHPERLGRLVLVGPAVYGRLTASGTQGDTLKHLVMTNWSMARRVMSSAIAPDGPSEFQRWISFTLRESVSPEMFVRYLDYVAALDIAAILPRVRTPSLVVSIEGDQTVSGSGGRDVAALLLDARLMVMPARFPISTDMDLGRAVTGFLDEGEDVPGPARIATRTSGLPQSMVAILFADIADSTALTERLGDAAFRERARQLDTALRGIIGEHSGTAIEGKLLGDGVLAVFASARQAIEAALACREAGGDAGLPLHLGVHAGDVIREEGNIYGGAVNIAARIADASPAGEVLVSQTVRDLARTSAGPSMEGFQDRGDRELKGVSEPVRVWSVREHGAMNKDQG